MKGKKLKRGLALVLGLMLAAEVPASVATPFQMFDSYAYTGAATVKATSLNVRSGAGTGYSSVGRLAAGAAVTVIGEQRGTDGNTWYQIQYTNGTRRSVNTGYVSSVYIRLPVAYTKDSDFEAYLTSQGFPESYKNGLRQLHANIRIGYSKPKTQVWTGTRLLKMSLFWAATLWPRAVFPPGNPLPTELITGTTVRGPDSTAATGWLPPRISYGITWTPEISWMRRMCSSSSTMNMMPIHRQRRG